VARGEFHRWCRRCGWKGTYATAAKGDYAKRRHSCEKWAEKIAGRQRRVERFAAVDRTPKPCLHKIADHQHGTRAAYVLDACRCLPCSAANAEAETARERQKAYGRYDRYVDAEPVRTHVLELGRQGMGLKRVAKAAGVSTGTLSKLVFGVYASTGTGGGRNGPGRRVRRPSKRVLRTTAEKLLAVRLDLADGAKITAEDAIGVRRRVRALVALGWSQSKLADRLGIQRSNFHLATDARGVTVATMRAVEELYDELSMTLPPQDTHRDRIAASRARNYAKARGWLPPLALDDDLIDRPCEGVLEVEVEDYLDEQAIWRRMHGDRSVRLTKAEKRELVRRAREAGWSYRDLETRAGIAKSERYIDQEAS
jgi:transcriptional regulator with XRE-family HTH domain